MGGHTGQTPSRTSKRTSPPWSAPPRRAPPTTAPPNHDAPTNGGDGEGAVGADGDAPNKGGAPIGNQNARKHGFYAKNLTPEQQEALPEARKAYSLVEEVAIMRVKVKALMENPNTDPDLILRAMSVLVPMVRIDDRVRYGP